MKPSTHRTIAFPRITRITSKALTIVVLILVPLPGGTFQESSAAAPASMSVGIEILAGDLRLTKSERASILDGLKKTVNSYGGKTGWECVKLPPWDVNDLGDLEPLPPIRIHITVWLRVATDHDGRMTGGVVVVDLRVEGQKGLPPRSLSVERRELEAGRGRALQAFQKKAVQTLEGLLEETTPCNFVAKLKGKSTWRDPDGPTIAEGSYSGEADLALRADGSFQGTMSIPESFVVTAAGIDCRWTESGGRCGECTITRQPGTWRVETSGQYRPQDARLLFERMAISTEEMGRSILTCPRRGQQNLPPVRVITDFAAVAVALADGAEVTMPPPPGWPGEGWSGDWDVRLQIEYPGSTGRISRSRVQPAQVAARTR